MRISDWSSDVCSSDLRAGVAPGCCDIGALDEDGRRIGIVEIPPGEKRPRIVDGPAEQIEPWLAKLGLEAETPRGTLGRGPSCEAHDQKDRENLSPEDFRIRHARAPQTIAQGKRSQCGVLQELVRGDRGLG